MNHPPLIADHLKDPAQDFNSRVKPAESGGEGRPVVISGQLLTVLTYVARFAAEQQLRLEIFHLV